MFRSYEHHSLLRSQKRNKAALWIYFQWKARGSIFTEKVQKNVKEKQKEAEKRHEQVNFTRSSQFVNTNYRGK
ncbi:hypothetical protein HXY33_08775 [Candidatus Bathyarchaeota archaeon]|nr:hypothetical protein [Candidatus Bathyarchaeota archaeon]